MYHDETHKKFEVTQRQQNLSRRHKIVLSMYHVRCVSSRYGILLLSEAIVEIEKLRFNIPSSWRFFSKAL